MRTLTDAKLTQKDKHRIISGGIIITFNVFYVMAEEIVTILLSWLHNVFIITVGLYPFVAGVSKWDNRQWAFS